MNRFDELFFSKYVSDGTKILTIIHRHIIIIVDKIILTYFFGAIIPSFLYYYSFTIKAILPFFVLEIFLIGIFIKGIYDILNRYNDVWIVTDEGVVDLEWELFSANSITVKYNSIEGLEYIEKGFIDAILKKGDIVIHKIGGGDEFVLENATDALYNIEMIDKKLKSNKKPHTPKNYEVIQENPLEQNFDTVMKALSGVVENYLRENGYKADDSEEKKALIKEIKRKGGAIDLTSQPKNNEHEEDEHDSHGHGHHH